MLDHRARECEHVAATILIGTLVVSGRDRPDGIRVTARQETAPWTPNRTLLVDAHQSQPFVTVPRVLAQLRSLATPIGSRHTLEDGGRIFSEPLCQISENGGRICAGLLRQSVENGVKICSEPLRHIFNGIRI